MAESVSRLAAFGLASALLIGGGCRNADAPEPVAAAERFECGTAITHVTVIDGTGSPPQPDRTVLIHGDRIVVVRPAAAVTVGPGVRVIDGRGKFLMPGLWDMHAHLTEPALLPLLTRHGVTGVRHMFSANPLYAGRRGFAPADPGHPRVIGADQLIDGPGSPLPWNVFTVDRPAAARPAVEKVARGGNDFVKVYPSLSKPSYLAVLDAAREHGLDVVGHLPREVTAAEASAAGQRSIEHLDGVAVGCSANPERWTAELLRGPGPGAAAKLDHATGWRVQLRAHEQFDDQRAKELFAGFVRNGTYHVPTLVQTRAAARLATAEWDDGKLPPFLKVSWRRDRLPDGGVTVPLLGVRSTAADLRDRDRLFRADLELVRRMHAAGVRLLPGTDAPYPGVLPGESLHDELELLVEAGMTPLEAIRAATVSASECLRRADQVGSIADGMLADLVLLDRDPAADVRNTRSVRTVFVGGREAWTAER